MPQNLTRKIHDRKGMYTHALITSPLYQLQDGHTTLDLAVKYNQEVTRLKVGKKGIIEMRCRADVCDYVQACMKVLIDYEVPGSLFVAIKKGWAKEVAALIASTTDVNVEDAVCTTRLLLLALVPLCYISVYICISICILIYIYRNICICILIYIYIRICIYIYLYS